MVDYFKLLEYADEEEVYEIRLKIFKENVGLACSVLKKLHAIGKEDFFQQAMEGLWKAILTFDYKKGYAFSTYAERIIIGYVSDAFNQEYLIPVSRHIQKKAHNGDNKAQEYINRFRNVSPIEHAMYLSISHSIEDQVIEKEEMDQLQQAIAQLTENEKKLIKERFVNNKSYQAIGKTYNLPKQTVYSQVQNIFAKLRRGLKL